MKLFTSTSAFLALMVTITITTALSMTEPVIDDPDMTVSILPVAETQTTTATATTTTSDDETVTALPLLPNAAPPSGFVTIFIVAPAAPTAEPTEPKTLAPRGNDKDDKGKKKLWRPHSDDEIWDPENKKGHHEPTFENSGPPFCFRRFDDEDTQGLCPNGETPEFSWKCTVLNLPVGAPSLSLFSSVYIC